MSVRKGWAAVALVAVAVAAASASAGGIDIGTPWVLTFHFGVSPTKLSRKPPTQVRVSLSGTYKTADDSHVPALRELQLEGDRHLAFDLKEAPVCSGGHYDYRGALEDFCGDAVIGHGKLTVEVEFPEEPPRTVTGDLSLYNGGRKGNVRRLLANATLPSSVAREVSIPITIRKVDEGRVGWIATAAVPKIAGGAGSITAYSLRIGRRFLTANCGGGRLELRALSYFVDGTKLLQTGIRTCAVTEPHVRQ
jgi:hypothetical protein